MNIAQNVKSALAPIGLAGLVLLASACATDKPTPRTFTPVPAPTATYSQRSQLPEKFTDTERGILLAKIDSVILASKRDYNFPKQVDDQTIYDHLILHPSEQGQLTVILYDGTNEYNPVTATCNGEVLSVGVLTPNIKVMASGDERSQMQSQVVDAINSRVNALIQYAGINPDCFQAYQPKG